MSLLPCTDKSLIWRTCETITSNVNKAIIPLLAAASKWYHAFPAQLRRVYSYCGDKEGIDSGSSGRGKLHIMAP